MSSHMRLNHISKIFGILSQNLTKVLYSLKFLLCFSKGNTASHMIQADWKSQIIEYFFVFF